MRGVYNWSEDSFQHKILDPNTSSPNIKKTFNGVSFIIYTYSLKTRLLRQTESKVRIPLRKAEFIYHDFTVAQPLHLMKHLNLV